MIRIDIKSMNIADSRKISYNLHDSLMDAYSKGILVPHRFPDGRSFMSWPDAETILMPMNTTQDTERLTEFVSKFATESYTYNNKAGLTIRGAKISFPHKRLFHDVPPPHPSMDDEDLLEYIWPNASIVGSYASVLYIDIGSENRSYQVVESEEIGEFEGIVVDDQTWVGLMDWPVMVGSNRCNMAVIRSYLDDEEYGERAKYILETLTHCEFSIPDGYFIIQGRMKKVNTIDRLQMNMPYTLTSNKFTSAIRGIICEIRSIDRNVGISTHSVHLVSVVETKNIPHGVDHNIYKFYRSTVALVLEKDSTVGFNIYDIISGVGAVMEDMDTRTSSAMLTDMVAQFSRNDPEVMRVMSLTYSARADLSKIEDARRYAQNVISPAGKKSVSAVFLPHARTFKSKVMMLSIMTIDIILTVLGKISTTDMKNFIYKRFDSVGHRLKDYLRSMLQRSHNISDINKNMNNLVSALGQNKWPTSYRPTRRGPNKDEGLDSAIVNDVPIYNNAAILDSIRMIKIGASNTGNTSGTRRVHTSQYGFQCPANTPENENIGLNNALSEICLVSEDLTDEEKDIIDSYIYDEQYQGGDILLIYDGQPLSFVHDTLYFDLIEARSTGTINQGVGIAIHNMWDNLNIGPKVIVVRISHGRPLEPLIRLPESISVEDMNNLSESSWDSLIEDGTATIADAYEVSFNMVIAPWIHDAIDRVENDIIYFKKDYTHSYILPGDMLSQATNCLSFLEHNPAARGTYATLHVKQSIAHPFLFPEDRFDHESSSITNPEPPLISTRTSRRIGMTGHVSKYIPYSDRSRPGYGTNLNIAFVSDFGNVDDAVHISQRVVDKGLLSGNYYDIFTSNQNISISTTYTTTYNTVISKRQNIKGEMEYMEIRGEDGIGLIDPDFSNSVITPYSHPTIIEVVDIGNGEYLGDIDYRLTGHYMYHIEDGLLYVKYGFKVPLIYTYRDNISGEIVEREYTDLTLTTLPGMTKISSPRRGRIIHLMALAAIREDKIGGYDKTFISDDTFEYEGNNWYVSRSDMPVPRSKSSYPDKGMTVAIMKRRTVKRGDVAIKVIERNGDTITKVKKEKFSVTFGVIEAIERGPIVKIRIAMPILPEPGNKYASLYAQKSVCARVLPIEDVPIARWRNPITGEDEEMQIDILFNSLSLPSRMTMGMEYEVYITGTLSYLRDKGILDLYNEDREEFDTYMLDTYKVEDAALIIDELSDSTPFVYDNVDKKEKCRNLRIALGLPPDSMYDMFYVKNGEVQSKIQEKIACGTVYYVALRHLVDNKRRARGYVGKRDPLTLQPVKGKRRQGGASTGTMESDVYKSHGARSMLYERMAKVSDAKIVYKCDRCGGLVSKTNDTYRCIDEDAIILPSQVSEVSSVVSWELFRYYIRALGLNITEHFE